MRTSESSIDWTLTATRKLSSSAKISLSAQSIAVPNTPSSVVPTSTPRTVCKRSVYGPNEGFVVALDQGAQSGTIQGRWTSRVQSKIEQAPFEGALEFPVALCEHDLGRLEVACRLRCHARTLR